MKKAILISLAAAVLMPMAAWATDVTVTADVFSAYVSRGAVGNDEPVFQPDICFDMPYGFDFDLWANMDLTDNEKSWAPDSAWRWSEFDFQLGWSAPLGDDSPVGIRVASTYYTYPQYDDDDDYDVSVAIKGNCPLNPKVRFVHECDRDDNYRLDFFLSHDIELVKDNLRNNDCGIIKLWISANYFLP